MDFLRARVRPQGSELWYNVQRREETKVCMLDTIHAKRDEIHAIARKHKAERLWVFGSVARKEERPDSDIDFLVEFGKTATLFDHGRLYNSLNAIFSQGVDVVDRGGIREGSPFARMIEKDLVAV